MTKIKPRIPSSAWIADTATVRGDVVLGEDVSVWFGAVARGDSDKIRVGNRTNIQDGAVLHTSTGFPCLIGNNVTVGHRAIVHGCTVHDGALIGMGAIVLDGAEIGYGAIVGAGAVVPPNMVVPSETMVLGVPAKIVGPVKERMRGAGIKGADAYVAHKEDYRNGRY